MRISAFAMILVVPALLLAACQPATPGVAATQPVPATGGTAQPPAASPTPAILTPPASADELVKLSKGFLNEHFQIGPENVSVTEVTPMTWPDASLGCPKIGVMYIQVVTPGYQVVLQANDHTFTFHTDAKSQVVLCSVNPPDEAFPTPGL